MYLNTLNEEQKTIFLDLCILAAKANNVVAEDEIAIINEYCNEMQIAARYEEERNLDLCIEDLKKDCNKRTIKIIVLELTALILSDNICDEDEEKYIQEFISRVGITKSEYEKTTKLLNKLSSIYSEINEFVAE